MAKTNKSTDAPDKDSNQPWNLLSLIRGLDVHSKDIQGSKLPACLQLRLYSALAAAKTDPRFSWDTHAVSLFLSYNDPNLNLV